MGRFAHNDVLDGSLLVIKNNATRIVLCLAQPNNFTEASSVYALASAEVTSADFTIANDEDSGRKLVVAAQTGTPVSKTGIGTHTAVIDAANSKLLFVTPTSDTPVVENGSVDLSTWDIQLTDPLPA